MSDQAGRNVVNGRIDSRLLVTVVHFVQSSAEWDPDLLANTLDEKPASPLASFTTHCHCDMLTQPC